MIEFLVVVGILTILGAMVFTSVNPVVRLQATRNARRYTEVESILKAIKQYQIDHRDEMVPGVDSTLRMLGTTGSGCQITCGGPSGATQTLFRRIVNADDDAEEQNPPNGYMYMDSSDLELVRDGTRSQEIGMRFTNLTLPQGATIVEGHLEFAVDESSSESTTLNFYGEAVDDSVAFTEAAGDITRRRKTQSRVIWSEIPAWSTYNATVNTPNLASVLQEIISRPGWRHGNDLDILINGTGRRVARSYEGNNARAPLLSLQYDLERTAEACLNIGSALQGYLGSIPIDPRQGTGERTHYAVKEMEPGVVKVAACASETGEIIEMIQ